MSAAPQSIPNQHHFLWASLYLTSISSTADIKSHSLPEAPTPNPIWIPIMVLLQQVKPEADPLSPALSSLALYLQQSQGSIAITPRSPGQLTF